MHRIASYRMWIHGHSQGDARGCRHTGLRRKVGSIIRVDIQRPLRHALVTVGVTYQFAGGVHPAVHSNRNTVDGTVSAVARVGFYGDGILQKASSYLHSLTGCPE